METGFSNFIQGLDQQTVDSFLRLARGANNKQDFLSRVREFDQKFLDSYPSPTMPPAPQIPKSNHSSQIQGQHRVSNTPIKNPFAVQPEQKYRNNRPNSFLMNLQTQPQYDYQTNMNKVNNTMVPPSPYSRSENNFYPTQNRADFQELQHNFANNYTLDDGPYMQQNTLDRSFNQMSNPPHMPNRGNPMGHQNYVPTNQFLSSYEADDPDFVKYYKKGRVDNATNHKIGLGMQGRGNPFKQV